MMSGAGGLPKYCAEPLATFCMGHAGRPTNAPRKGPKNWETSVTARFGSGWNVVSFGISIAV
jgi:hypothetical protein